MTKGPENTAAKTLPHFKQLGPCIPLKVCGNRKSPPVLPQARRTLERAGSHVTVQPRAHCPPHAALAGGQGRLLDTLDTLSG